MNEIFDPNHTFADLGLGPAVLKGIDELGFERPTTIQASLIPAIMQGKDVFGQAKTGTGKTAAFALPILDRAEQDTPMQALILAPTRELAVQITAEIDTLAKHTPMRCVAIVGGNSMRSQTRAVKDGAQIMVGTPGRMMDMHQRRIIHFDNIRFAVLDEVDRMLDIGFRDDIRRILSHVKTEHQTIFVSATISDDIERLARRFMREDQVEKITTVASSLTVSMVIQKYMAVHPKDKRRLLMHLLTHEDPALTVVFCRTKQTVRRLTDYLCDKGIRAHQIHGDLHQGKRNRVMQQLRGGKLEVLIASDLAARGLDVQGISHIINYDLPEDPEIYVHRIGRTARAGASGTAWSFVTPEEGQRLTDIEKLTGVLIEALDYPDFEPGHYADEHDDRPADRPDRQSRYAAPAHVADEQSDPAMFPSGVVPKSGPRRTLGARFRTKRSRR